MREIVIDTETTGLGKAEEHLMSTELPRDRPVTEPSTNEFLPASRNQSDDSSSERRERQYEQMGVLDDQGRRLSRMGRALAMVKTVLAE